MSASLVGSEMCIRDRHGPSRAQANGTYGIEKHGCGDKALLIATAEDCNCLLYTSDAADDM
eukprot:9780230-Alexandrium_andersonii.AAC.1